MAGGSERLGAAMCNQPDNRNQCTSSKGKNNMNVVHCMAFRKVMVGLCQMQSKPVLC